MTPRGRRRRDIRWRAANVPVPEAHVVALAVGLGLQRFRPWALPGPRFVRRLAGGSLAAVGAFLIVWSVRAAGGIRLGEPDRLVTGGPYGASRNPMYLGWGLVHLGVGLTAGSGWVVALLPAAALWTHRQVLREEAGLAAVFPDEFPAYQRDVPRYLRQPTRRGRPPRRGRSGHRAR